MSEQQSLSAQMRAITISREYGSGGGEIANRLADKLGWQLIDHEVVVRIAQELGISEREAALHDEYTDSLMARILTSMRTASPAVMIDVSDIFNTDEQSCHRALVSVVKAAYYSGHVVIVGRGSQVILADRRDALHVRVVAPIEKRVAYVVQREGLSRDDARVRIQAKDRQRARYLQVQHHNNSEDPHLYDLVLNTGVISLDGVVELVYQALEQKAARLSVSEHELGPGAGETNYPGQPKDFSPSYFVDE